MTRQRDVERWAQSPRPRTAMWEIEERVLLEHPDARRWPSSWRWLRQSSVGGIVQVALLLLPIGAVVALVQTPSVGLIRNAMDEAVAVPLAGVCYLLSIVLLASTVVDWVVDGRPRDPGALAPAGITLVSAALGIVLAGGVEGGLGAWAVTPWLAGVPAAMLLVAMLVAGRPKAAAERLVPVDVARIDASSRAELLDLRARTLRTLADRGLVDGEIVARAATVPLGALASIQPKPGASR